MRGANSLAPAALDPPRVRRGAHEGLAVASWRAVARTHWHSLARQWPPQPSNPARARSARSGAGEEAGGGLRSLSEGRAAARWRAAAATRAPCGRIGRGTHPGRPAPGRISQQHALHHRAPPPLPPRPPRPLRQTRPPRWDDCHVSYAVDNWLVESDGSAGRRHRAPAVCDRPPSPKAGADCRPPARPCFLPPPPAAA